MEEGYEVAALHKYKLFKLELLGPLSVGKTHLSSFLNFVCVMDDPISTIVGIIGVASLHLVFFSNMVDTMVIVVNFIPFFRAHAEKEWPTLPPFPTNFGRNAGLFSSF